MSRPVAPPQPLPERAQRERRIERLRAERGKDRRPAALRDELAGDGIAPVEPDLAELADVAKSNLASVSQLQHQPNVRIEQGPGRHHEELAGHLEMNGQCATPR